MLKTDSCPFCGEDGVNLSSHLRTPEGEGCPYTPVTRSTQPPAPSSVEGNKRQGRPATSGSGKTMQAPAEGRDAANPATTLN